MRDLKLIMPANPQEVGWTLDFDIVNGCPQFVAYPRNTQDQRASLAAYTLLGSIPGKPDVGVNWTGLWENSEETLVALDNEIKQAIQKYAAIPGGPTSKYVPVYEQGETGIKLSIYQG